MELHLKVADDWRELDIPRLKILLYALLDKQDQISEHLRDVLYVLLSKD